MDTVTYPHTLVKKELAHWIVGKVDVSEDPAVARAFGVEAVPVAVALRSDGTVLGRILDFVEPMPFQDRLLNLRKGEHRP